MLLEENSSQSISRATLHPESRRLRKKNKQKSYGPKSSKSKINASILKKNKDTGYISNHNVNATFAGVMQSRKLEPLESSKSTYNKMEA